MIDFAVTRMVGNELPPRDTGDSKLQALKHVLEHEVVRFHRLWILNRIIDPGYKSIVQELLKGEKVIDIPFCLKEYSQIRSFKQKILYVTNLNGARNEGLRLCQNYRFIIPLDQDCYYWPEEWSKTVEIIEADQLKNDRKYYFSPVKRFHLNNLHLSLNDLPDEEPMIIFRNDAGLKFDPRLRYGDHNKMDLLQRIGVEYRRGKKIVRQTDQSLEAGSVAHIAFSDPKIETNLGHRMKIRQKSIDRMIDMLNQRLALL